MVINHEQRPGLNAHGRSDKNDRNKSKTKNKTNQNGSNNNDKGYNNNNNRYWENSRMASLLNTLSRNFEGEESSIEVVLGLRFEKLRINYPSGYSERRWVTKFQGPWSKVTKW